VGVVVVDANDVPTLERTRFHVPGEFDVVHIVPEVDAVAEAVGRGSRHHLFYWRHSPQLLEALPPTHRFDVHSDADIVFVRPFDLGSLLGPLEQGRIAAAIDESTLDYYQAVQALAETSGASGGPLLQGGLLFRNPADDGGFYLRFWDFAVEAAASGQLSHLPWDDMGILSILLAQGGPLWERLLILGHEWNFITDANKDPGVFGCAAHYGGRRAQALLLAHCDVLFPPEASQEECDWWGRVGGARPAALPVSGNCSSQGTGSFALPCSITWNVPARAADLTLSGQLLPPAEPLDVTAFVYLDGRLDRHCHFQNGCFRTTIPLHAPETVTVIVVSAASVCEVSLYHAFDHRLDVGA